MADITISDREQNSMLVNIGLVCLGTATFVAGYEVYVDWTNQTWFLCPLFRFVLIHMPKESLYERRRRTRLRGPEKWCRVFLM